jgi:hypothetical protein
MAGALSDVPAGVAASGVAASVKVPGFAGLLGAPTSSTLSRGPARLIMSDSSVGIAAAVCAG